MIILRSHRPSSGFADRERGRGSSRGRLSQSP
jgi:hypothetical protein